MLSRLVKEMNALSQADDDDTSQQPQQPRRKSARLNNRKPAKEEPLHDSGTESDEEEIRNLNSRLDDNPFSTWKSCEDFLPLRLTSSPPVSRDYDTESWYSFGSFGRESGIMTGDNDSDTDGNCTPTVRRRMKDTTINAAKQEDAEKRRSATSKKEDEPIAARLRSNAEPVRPVKVAVRRMIPVRVIINRPGNSQKTDDVEETAHVAPAPKRNRRNSHRPSLDFEKMVKNKIDDTPGTSSRSSPKKDSIVTRSQLQN